MWKKCVLPGDRTGPSEIQTRTTKNREGGQKEYPGILRAWRNVASISGKGKKPLKICLSLLQQRPDYMSYTCHITKLFEVAILSIHPRKWKSC